MSVQTLFRQARIRDVPFGWKLTTVGESCKIRNDLRKPISVGERKKIEGKFPYYGPTGILSFIQEYLVEGTFALIGEDGDHFLKFETKDQTLLVHGRFNVNNHAHLIEATKDCSAEWFFYYFQHRNITPFLTRQGVGRYKLNKDALQKLPILLPPAYQQTLIVNLLSTWDVAIKKTEKLIEAKETRYSALVYKLINHQLEEWEHLRVEKIFETTSEKKNEREALLSVTQDRGVIPRSMLKGRVMSPQGSTDSYKLIQPGDFAISLRSFQGGIEYSDYRGIISPAYTVLRPRLNIHYEFYRHFFKTYLFINKYLNIAVIGIRDGKQISIPDFMTVKIPYPPLSEQERIAEILDLAKRDLYTLRQLASAYRKQKRGLMQKLLAGTWHVRFDEAC